MKRLLLTMMMLSSVQALAQAEDFAKLQEFERHINSRFEYLKSRTALCMKGDKRLPLAIMKVGTITVQVRNILANAQAALKCKSNAGPECEDPELVDAEKKLNDLIQVQMTPGAKNYEIAYELYSPEKCGGDPQYKKYLDEVVTISKQYSDEYYRLKGARPQMITPGTSGDSGQFKTAEKENSSIFGAKKKVEL